MEHNPPIMRITRRLAAPPEAVFAAWTDPASVATWMCPVPPTEAEPLPGAVELDLRVGGKFSISMEHEGTVFTHRGEYIRLSPPHQLVFTWIIPLPDGDRATLVTVNLEVGEDDTTEMEILHQRLPGPDMVDRHEAGWSAILQRLKAHLQ